jgi:hypothetical protein
MGVAVNARIDEAVGAGQSRRLAGTATLRALIDAGIDAYNNGVAISSVPGPNTVSYALAITPTQDQAAYSAARRVTATETGSASRSEMLRRFIQLGLNNSELASSEPWWAEDYRMALAFATDLEQEALEARLNNPNVTMPELAGRLGITYGTLRMRIQHAVARVRQ